jgi:hypothetical protein
MQPFFLHNVTLIILLFWSQGNEFHNREQFSEAAAKYKLVSSIS